MGILIAYLIGILTAINSEHKNRGQKQCRSNSGDCQTFTDRTSPVISIPPALSVEECAAQKKKETQKTISFWVKNISLGVLIIYAGFTILIWCANKKMADIATRELELSKRPWVDAQVFMDGPFTLKPDDTALPLRFDLRNTGLTPAISIQIRAEITDSDLGTGNDTIKERLRLCNETANKTFSLEGYQDTIFPNEKEPRQVTYSVPFHEGDEKRIAAEHRTTANIRLIECVAYRPTFKDDVAYYTGNIYNIERSDRKPTSFKVGEEALAANVAIKRWTITGTIVGKFHPPKH
jgi:hypothetical protein